MAVQYKKKEEKPKFAGITTPKKFVPGDRSAWYEMLEGFKRESEVPTLADIPDGDLNIVCATCRNKVGYITPRECKLPLRGNMIKPHRGCEHWPLPMPMASPLEFICPHAYDGDLHLFVNVVEGKHEEARTFILEDGRQYNVINPEEVRECLCGCGARVVGEKKEYAGLECWKRHMMELHGETLDEPEEATEGRVCPCGCGGEVKKNNKYADRLNCYRREQALIGKQAEIEDGTRDS